MKMDKYAIVFRFSKRLVEIVQFVFNDLGYFAKASREFSKFRMLGSLRTLNFNS